MLVYSCAPPSLAYKAVSRKVHAHDMHMRMHMCMHMCMNMSMCMCMKMSMCMYH